MMFQPKLTLKLGKSGTYTLVIQTTVPDGCYYAGEVTEGTPGGIGIPEIKYFTAVIERRDGICTTALKEIVHVVEGLELNEGKYGVAVTTTFNGQLVGSGYVSKGAMSLAGLDMTTSTGGGILLEDHVAATVIGGIVAKYTLVVTASAQVWTSGYSASLTKVAPQGISPATLLLDLTLTPPSKNALQVVSIVTGHYHEDDYKGDHHDVTVRLGNQLVTVPIIMIYGFGAANAVGASYRALIR